jgi:hypothetical protein
MTPLERLGSLAIRPLQHGSKVRSGFIMSSLVRVTMTGGARGAWQITQMRTVAGKGLADVGRPSVVESLSASLPQEGEKSGVWSLHGCTKSGASVPGPSGLGNWNR